MNELNELQLLKARVDVMQREVREALGLVNQDFHTVLGQLTTALKSLDYRLDQLEQAAGLKVTGNPVDENNDGNGKEL